MPLVLAVIAAVALLAAHPAGAQSDPPPPPPPPAAIDQYTESVPTASGSAKAGRSKHAKPRTSAAIRAQAGNRAATLEQIASSGETASPPAKTKATRKPKRADATKAQPTPNDPASALEKPSVGSAVSDSAGFPTLLVVLLVGAAAAIAAAVVFRLRHRHSA